MVRSSCSAAFQQEELHYSSAISPHCHSSRRGSAHLRGCQDVLDLFVPAQACDLRRCCSTRRTGCRTLHAAKETERYSERVATLFITRATPCQSAVSRADIKLWPADREWHGGCAEEHPLPYHPFSSINLCLQSCLSRCCGNTAACYTRPAHLERGIQRRLRRRSNVPDAQLTIRGTRCQKIGAESIKLQALDLEGSRGTRQRRGATVAASRRGATPSLSALVCWADYCCAACAA
jgi:hypothetical protein